MVSSIYCSYLLTTRARFHGASRPKISSGNVVSSQNCLAYHKIVTHDGYFNILWIPNIPRDDDYQISADNFETEYSINRKANGLTQTFLLIAAELRQRNNGSNLRDFGNKGEYPLQWCRLIRIWMMSLENETATNFVRLKLTLICWWCCFTCPHWLLVLSSTCNIKIKLLIINEIFLFNFRSNQMSCKLSSHL